MADAREILRQYPDLRTAVQGINPLASGGQRLADLELDLRGPDLDRLQEYADRLMVGMRKLPGLVDVETSLAVARPSSASSSIATRPLTSESTCSTSRARCRRTSPACRSRSTRRPDEQYDIWLRAQPGKRRTPQDVYDLTGARCVRAARAAREPGRVRGGPRSRRRSTASTGSAP
jgi:HAE1 family hydrophobic/amphiphilic exporter-1